GGDHGAAVVWRAELDRQHRGDAERTVLARGAERAVPQRAPGGQLDRADAAVGRLLAQQAGHLHAPAGVDVHRVGGAGLRVAGALGTAHVAAGLAAGRPAHLVRLRARHQRDVVRHVVVVGDDDAAARIDGDAAPVGAAVVARVLHGVAAGDRRGVEALVARVGELDAADHLVDRGQ